MTVANDYVARLVTRLNVNEGTRTERVIHTLDGVEREVSPQELLNTGRRLWELWNSSGLNQPHDVILGLDAGGILPTVAVSFASKSPYRLAWKVDLDLPEKQVFYEPHANRTAVFTYGDLSSQRILIVDDEITTGRTVANLINTVREAGGTVAGVLCLVEDTSGNGRALVESSGVTLCALTRL